VNFEALYFVCKELAGALHILLTFSALWSCWKENNSLGSLLPSFNAQYL